MLNCSHAGIWLQNLTSPEPGFRPIRIVGAARAPPLQPKRLPVNKRGSLKKKLSMLPPPSAGMDGLKAQWERAWEALQKAYDDLEQVH